MTINVCPRFLPAPFPSKYLDQYVHIAENSASIKTSFVEGGGICLWHTVVIEKADDSKMWYLCSLASSQPFGDSLVSSALIAGECTARF